MKLTNWQLMNCQESINKLIKLELPIKASFPLLKNIKKIEELITIIHKQHDDIVFKYSVKDEAGNPKKEVDENGKEIQNKIMISDPESLNKEINELMSLDNEVEIIQISSDLDVNLSVSELVKIDWLFN